MRGQTTSSVSLTPRRLGHCFNYYPGLARLATKGCTQPKGGGGSHRYPSVSQASTIPGTGLEREKGETDNELEKNRRCKRREKK